MRSPSPGRRRDRRRRAWQAAIWSVAALVVLVAALVVNRAVATTPARTSAPTTAPAVSTVPSTTTTTPAESLPVPIGTYSVGTSSLTVAVPPQPTSPAQNIPVQVWYPAAETRNGPVPDRVGGPFPLLAFSQGYDLSVQSYAALLGDWASAGFVVAGPTYPHTDPGDPSGLNEEDIVNHPADLRTVVAGVVANAKQAGSPLLGMIDATRIGLVGHSDGGDVSLAVAANTCCRDPLVKAVAVLSGAELGSFGGTYFTAPTVPILVVQGNADIVNVPACSTQIYNAAPTPKYYLDLLGAAHEPPYIDPGPVQEIVAETVAAFFEATLNGRHSAVPAMSAVGNVAGTAQLTVGGTAPPEPGTCPGAPA